MKPWPANISRSDLVQRAKQLHQVRTFFNQRDVVEVITPYLSPYTVTDPHTHSWQAKGDVTGRKFYLHTSPEYAMKQMIASGSGSVYQIAKVFRDDETSPWHQPEFLMLEWYRVGWTHQQLIQEVIALFHCFFNNWPCKYFSYQQLFESYLEINPHQATTDILRAQAIKQKIALSTTMLNQTTVNCWLDLLFSHVIQPQLPSNCFVIIDAFPVSQASLAKIVKNDQGVHTAQRFEILINGVECANGFNELNHAQLQQQRFNQDRSIRKPSVLPNTT